MKLLLLFFMLFLALPSAAQIMPNPYPLRPMMHNPSSIQNLGQGIYNHQVVSATSPDGLNWTKNDNVVFDHASVPDAVIDKTGTIFLYFMDASSGHEMSVAMSTDQGKTWQKKTVAITGRQTQGHAVDPNPLILNDGKIRLFYLGTFGPPDPRNPGAANAKICSALSSDGIHFVEEGGFRFSGKGLTDPDVIKTPTGWKMFVSQGREDLSTSSPDGITFTQDEKSASTTGAISDTIAMEDGYRLYKCSQGGIHSQFTKDFKTWTEEGLRISGGFGFGICDPGIIKLPNGTYKMFYKQMPVIHPVDRQ